VEEDVPKVVVRYTAQEVDTERGKEGERERMRIGRWNCGVKRNKNINKKIIIIKINKF
jgi:hypothetical protein